MISEMCSHPRTSVAGKLVQELPGTEQYEINIRSTDEGLKEKMNEHLRDWQPGISAFKIQTCAISPEYPKTSEGNTLRTDFSWTSRENPDPSGRPANTHSSYNLNGTYGTYGTYGTSDETPTKLHIECDLPGELGQLSQRTPLVAHSSNTVYVGPRVGQDARDRQIHFLHLMARKATDAVGYETEPLKKNPVMKVYRNTERATEASK